MRAGRRVVTNPTRKFAEFRDGDVDEAKFFWTGGPVEVAERTWFASFFSGSTAFETDEGLVLVDTGMVRAAPALRDAIRTKTEAPVHTIIYTHGHIDHGFGTHLWQDEAKERRLPQPRIVAHEKVPERYRRYRQTVGYNERINHRQFGAPMSFTDLPYREPDTLYSTELELRVGGISFELHHARGETDDHTWVYCPERRVLCPGDLIINAAPNAGNPQKVQRYPWDWADALEEMAARSPAPAALCPGHGGPRLGERAVREVLSDTAAYLRALVGDALAMLNDGVPHDEIVNSVKPPAELARKPYLQPVYDDPEFIVRNVLRYFGGWHDLNPANLMPATSDAQAGVIVELAGGLAKLVERARKLAAEGNLRLASHVADWAFRAARDDPEARLVRAEIFGRRAEESESLMASNLFRAAAEEAGAVPQPPGSRESGGASD